MNCPNCPNENLTDYVLCPTCATTCHFTNRTDCRCLDCATKRELAKLPEALRERFAGALVIATSDDAPGSVRVPFSFDALKPECRLPIAQGLSELVNRLGKAA